jgi:hypothetical protein
LIVIGGVALYLYEKAKIYIKSPDSDYGVYWNCGVIKHGVPQSSLLGSVIP